ncbi:MAG: AAA family ATPase [Bacilli bacterium]
MNKDTAIRINSIEINNIKNVINGTVSLNEIQKDSNGASVTGVYGQNGSGKTALVWSIGLLKNALSGIALPNDTAFYIFQNKEQASIKVEFIVSLKENKVFNVWYTLVIKRLEGNKTSIVSEKVDFKTAEAKKITILDVESDSGEVELDKCLYGPESRLKEMTKKDKQIKQKLMVLQALAKEKNISYIFNESLLNLLKTSFQEDLYFDIFSALLFYGRMNLFVLNKNSETSFNMYLLPLSMRLESDKVVTKCDAIPVGLGQNSCDEKTFNTIDKIIRQIDVLIGTIIPGLNIEIIKSVPQLNEKAETKVVFELASNRNGIITPLRYESEGVKKILCILSSLIAMYNDSSIFVAIDEMDSGIFEYLLGEFLSVVNKTGKGQLLFTSHNMRPLEVLDKSNIYFTTTNPENKYIQFTGIKSNNNLRSTLLRTIDLGGQKESVYENTSSYQIGKAFRKAGELVDDRK